MLLAWAYCAHSHELHALADKDQTYMLSAILDWLDAHPDLAAALASVWLLLQAAAALLGACFACCCPAPRDRRHPWSVCVWGGGGGGGGGPVWID